ncbi:MAG TPA: ABC transporter permease [Planctomycetota bacterium]|nr:ABC transporter permease [Planctomycetota bacterium]
MIAGILRTFQLGLRGVARHGLRSLLTCLGVLFGVASVIAMLSIGEGLSHDVQSRIQALGSNNILVRSQKPPESTSASAERSRLSVYGITYEDAKRIKNTLPNAEVVVPARAIYVDARFGDRRADARVMGTVPWFGTTNRFYLNDGRFLTDLDVEARKPVCVLGATVAETLFPLSEPVGQLIKLGPQTFRVVGVMEPRTVLTGDQQGTLEDLSSDVYAPITTVRQFWGEVVVKVSSGSRDMERVELHQLQVRVAELGLVEPTAAVLKEMLEHAHAKRDYEVVVPLSLLREAERQKRIFNLVLGSIAFISLLVGGIGILNVMLATVTERTREIGVRRALGAKRRHIVAQFLVETIVLAGSGGVLGIGLGVAIPFVIEHYSNFKTIITTSSLVLSFGISVAIGVVFGLYPAWRAATMDPVEALRHD